ncbi:SurA N-terminal domain-containing protein [Thiotrichales bacterium 19S3-7]|nr:SurA N-terminal domain-containing protein [Thiotrichales bacterium 19S3-7]MCF6801901.1 SurA N-terminal domain-containing protein [Thiotrichales bacterium 19S3-11]
MLQSLHDKLKGWASAVIIGIISVVFVLWGISYYFEGNNQRGQTVAKVGKVNITDFQVQQQLNQIRQGLSQDGVTDLNNPKYQNLALSQLINQELQKQGALEMGVKVSQALIDQQITKMPYFQENGQFSKEKYEQFLRVSGYTLPMLRSMLEDNMLSSQVTVGLIGSDFVLPKEEDDAFNLLFQKRQVKFTEIPYSAVNLSNQKVTDNEIKAYYQSHQAQFIQPAEVKVKYIELTLADIEKRITVTDSQIQAYFDANKSQFSTKNADAKETVKPLSEVKQAIKQKLSKQQAQILYSSIGNKMANLAYEYPDSLDKAAKEAKVTVKLSDFFTQTSGNGIATNKDLREIAFSTDVLKNKYNSDVINISPTEAVIIRLDQYKPEQEKPLSVVSDQIRTMLVQKNKKEMLYRTANNVIKQLNDKKTINEIAGVNLEWNQKTITRSGNQLPENITKSIMAIAVNAQSQSSYQLAEGNDALYIYRIENVIQPSKSDTNYYRMQMQSESMAKNMQFSLQYQAYLDYLNKIIPVTKEASN